MKQASVFDYLQQEKKRPLNNSACKDGVKKPKSNLEQEHVPQIRTSCSKVMVADVSLSYYTGLAIRIS